MELCFVKDAHENSVTVFIENNRVRDRSVPFGDGRLPLPDDYNKTTEGDEVEVCLRTSVQEPCAWLLAWVRMMEISMSLSVLSVMGLSP